MVLRRYAEKGGGGGERGKRTGCGGYGVGMVGGLQRIEGGVSGSR